jgi:histidine triad (HIT) family protein
VHTARRVANALLATYRPLGILTFQNYGVYSGQETRH